jgi:hypothetical protein
MAYETFRLAMNLAGHVLPADDLAECNPGGSTICWSPTKGCGSGGMTCVGTSTKLEMLEVMVSLPSPEDLTRLKEELTQLIQKFAGR